MLIIMRQYATEEEVATVIETVRKLGYAAHSIPGSTRTAIGVTGNKAPIDRTLIESLPGVIQTVRVTKPYKLVSRETKPEDTVIEVGEARIGSKEIVVIAGPCSVESREQILTAAHAVKAAGGLLLRGGAFKPRTDRKSVV